MTIMVRTKEAVLMTEEWERLQRNGELNFSLRRMKNLGTPLIEHLKVTPQIGSPKEYIFCVFEKPNLKETKIYLDNVKALKALTQEALPSVQIMIKDFTVGVLSNQKEWEDIQKNFEGISKEVLLTTREWLKFKHSGSIQLPDYRMKAGKQIKLEDHFEIAPDIGQIEDSYILCTLRTFDDHQKIYFLDQVISFFAMTERAKNILLAFEEEPQRITKLLGVVNQDDWDRLNRDRIIKERWRNGNEFASLVTGRKHRNKKFSLDQAIKLEKIRDHLIEMKSFSDQIKTKNRRFVATPAGGYKIALSYLSLELQKREEGSDNLKEPLNKTWRNFQVKEKLEKLYKENKSGRLFDKYFEDFFNGFFDELKRQLTSSLDKDLLDQFRWNVFFYHYAGLIGDLNKKFALEDLSSDIWSILEPYAGKRKKIPVDLLNILYVLGGELPDEALYRLKQVWNSSKGLLEKVKAQTKSQVQEELSLF